MINVAQGLGAAEEWANTDQKPAVYPEPDPGWGNEQDWVRDHLNGHGR